MSAQLRVWSRRTGLACVVVTAAAATFTGTAAPASAYDGIPASVRVDAPAVDAPAVDAPAVDAPVIVSADADTYVVQEQPSQVYGTAGKLAASHWSTPWHSHVYIRFTVPPPPAGARVAAARVELTFQKLDQQPPLVELRSVASTTWPEATTSYANRPPLGPVVATVQPATQGAATMSFDVREALGAATGPRSFGLTNPSAQSAAVVHSRERGADGPRLVIEYAATPPTLCGASFSPESNESWQQALVREDGLFNGLEVVRTFYGGLPPAWPGQVDTGDRAHVVSFKGNARDHAAGTHDAHMRAWFASAPSNKDIYWVYYHEPEDNIRNGEFTAAEYRAAWARLSALAAEADNPRLHATMVLMEWTVNPASGRNWRDYYPSLGVLDVLAWDVYNYDSTAERGVYLPPAELIDRIVAANAAVGLPIGVAEMGSHLAPGDTGARRAAWIRSMNEYLSDRGSLWNVWFDIAWSTGDYRIRDSAGVAAWRDFCS